MRKSHLFGNKNQTTFSSFFPLDAPLDGLNEDQSAFYTLAFDFMESELKPNAHKWDTNHETSRPTIEAAARLGFGGLFVPESEGGTGLSGHNGTLIFEALSQGCVSHAALISIHNMVAWMLSTYGSDEIKSKYLESMVSCEV